ncbi:ABC transporter substrate-binding protein [Arthrobacter sp. NPDC080073]|uniref:ABC transporter substrate-binding protein n=1 Tax=Arthrobacter sp. NPDC080073 TaxID=3155919 RepID=UPI0034138796
MHHSIRIAGLAAAAIIALGLSGCAAGSVSGGGDGPAAATPGSGTLTTITLGEFPATTFAPVHLGDTKGIFAKHGIALKYQSGAGAAALLPGVMNGSIDVAVGNPVSVMQAAAKGLDVKIIAGYNRDNPAVKDETGVIVAMPSSGITRARDLVGKKVAINTLKNSTEVVVRAAVHADGGDDTKLVFTELPFPDMPAQLQGGGVDAAFMVQPFLGPTLAHGGTIISDAQVAAGLQNLIQVTFTSANWAKKNPELLSAFREAWTEALDYGQAHPEELRTTVPTFLPSYTQAQAAGLQFETFSANLDRKGLQVWADLAYKYGALTKASELDTIVLQ